MNKNNKSITNRMNNNRQDEAISKTVINETN